MAPGPLAGRRVVVTGDASRTSGLDGRLSPLGAEVVRLPVLALADPPDGGAALARAAERLVEGEFDWVVVTSANAVDRLRAALGDREVASSVRWAAVGPSTGAALGRAGFPCHMAPAAATAEALGAALAESSEPGRALYPRAARVRSDLAAVLGGRGWTVEEVVAYCTVAAEPDPAAREAALGADAVLFTSGSAVEQTVSVLGTDGVPGVVVTIGPTTSAVARDHGLVVAAEANPHSLEGLLGALVDALGPASGRPAG